MTPSVDLLARLGVLGRIDEHFARTLGRLVPGSSDSVLVAAALASRAVREGHVCADLSLIRRVSAPDGAGEGKGEPIGLPALSGWLEELSASPLVSLAEARGEPRPLVLSGPRLYLRRYFDYERGLADALIRRAESRPAVDRSALAASLARYFGDTSADGGKQRLAAAVAALRQLAVISGGPGTGKTYTVAKLLVVLAENARALGAPVPRVALLAPTGKAAARLAESIQGSLDALSLPPELARAVPTQAATIHRALGPLASDPTRFRHDARSPLPADLVVVDEASMIDVALMAKLVLAVPAAARLVLVGDKDQLASVEAGAILGDIYGDPDAGFSPGFTEALEGLAEVPAAADQAQGGAIGDCRVHLTVSHRYHDTSGIATLARAVNTGDPELALRALGSDDDVAMYRVAGPNALGQALAEGVLSAYASLGRGSPEERLARLGQFRILCAHRNGPFGVVAVNALVERLLGAHGLAASEGASYDGRPILVTENDYALELWNGDVGVLAADPRGAVEACFPGREGVRRVPLARLPPHETVFAMTVHKSQGSEFDRVAIVLPARESSLVTRELLYTAITRARSHVDIFGTEAVLRAGIAARVARASGLGEALRGSSA